MATLDVVTVENRKAGQIELPEEGARQLVIPMLTGVDEHLRVQRPESWDERRGLDQLRPRPDDGQEPHAVCRCEPVVPIPM